MGNGDMTSSSCITVIMSSSEEEGDSHRALLVVVVVWMRGGEGEREGGCHHIGVVGRRKKGEWGCDLIVSCHCHCIIIRG